jgi:hypothetical protein
LVERYRLALIGETRLAQVEGGVLVAMQLHRDGDGVAAGWRGPARLKAKLGSRGIAELPGGEEGVIEPWPASLAEGATLEVEATRAAWLEPGRARLARLRPARGPAPPLADERYTEAWPDDVAAQWDEAFEAAALGQLAAGSARLGFVPTPAFVAVDVDGAGAGLAVPALVALARAIRLWGMGGAIVIDLAGAPARAERSAAAAAFDLAMAGVPHERTAINGFGTMQVVVPRRGPSILERAQLEADAGAAVALLASAGRESRPGALRLVARPAVARWLLARPHLVAELARASGRSVDVAADPMAGEGRVETRA